VYILLYIYICICIGYWSVWGYKCANTEVRDEGARMMFKQHRDVKVVDGHCRNAAQS